MPRVAPLLPPLRLPIVSGAESSRKKPRSEMRRSRLHGPKSYFLTRSACLRPRHAPNSPASNRASRHRMAAAFAGMRAPLMSGACREWSAPTASLSAILSSRRPHLLPHLLRDWAHSSHICAGTCFAHHGPTPLCFGSLYLSACFRVCLRVPLHACTQVSICARVCE
jgi:hypothetical protein